MHLFVPFDGSDLARIALADACRTLTSLDHITVMAAVIVPASLEIGSPAGEIWKQVCRAEVHLADARAYAERVAHFGDGVRCVRVQARTPVAAIIAGAAHYEADTIVLAHQYGITPRDNESVVSQIAAQVFGGKGAPYFIIQIATTLILILAANTSYADFPRLGSILARDGFLPKQFQFRGDRLAFTIGIAVLTVLSTALYVVFGGQTDRLIPLYAVGVFVSFTLSQAGMVRHWQREPGNHTRQMAINGTGAVATGVVAIIFGYTKFLYGAWLVILIIPIIVLLCLGISRHYRRVAAEVRLTDDDTPPALRTVEQVVVVPISQIDKVSLNALVYARSLSSQVVAVRVTDDAAEATQLQETWEKRGEGVNLVILESPYRSLAGPLLSYIDLVQRKRPKAMVTVLVPEYVPHHWWEQLLHSQTALRLKASLLFRPNAVVTSVPYHSSDARGVRGY